MRKAEIRKTARLCKSEFIHEPCVVKGSGVAVHVIRRTELPIRRARSATGDTVAVPGPCPPHRVAHRDVDRARVERKTPTRRHRHVDGRAGSRWNASHGRPAVLIDNTQRLRTACVRHTRTLAARFSSHQKSHRQNGGDPED
jgi:hypothetical protein